MKNSNPTLSIPLTYPDYEVTVRQKEIARPDGTDTVCIGTLCHNGKPVAAAASKQRTAHYTEDIPSAIRQIAHDFERDIRKLSLRNSPQKIASTAVVENPLLEGVRRIREGKITIYPKNGNRGWNLRTQNSFLAIFLSQVAPLLHPYLTGEKAFLPSDLDSITAALKMKKAQQKGKKSLTKGER